MEVVNESVPRLVEALAVKKVVGAAQVMNTQWCGRRALYLWCWIRWEAGPRRDNPDHE